MFGEKGAHGEASAPRRQRLSGPAITRERVTGVAKLVERDANDTGSHHTERARSADREINDAAANERPPVRDATLYRSTAVRDLDDASKRPCAVRAGQFTWAAMSAIAIV